MEESVAQKLTCILICELSRRDQRHHIFQWRHRTNRWLLPRPGRLEGLEVVDRNTETKSKARTTQNGKNVPIVSSPEALRFKGSRIS